LVPGERIELPTRGLQNHYSPYCLLTHLNAQDFYSRLDRAVERSERAKLIEGHAIRDE